MAIQRAYNNPVIGQAMANIASLFDPPSGQEAAGWAAANAKNAEAKRLAEFYAGAPGMDREAYDRLGPVLGLFTPNQGLGITERSQDLGYRASTENNARDNARALEQTNLQNANAVTTTMLAPVAAGATRFVPPDIADMYGVQGTQVGTISAAPGERVAAPDGRMIEGAPKPLSETEAIAELIMRQPEAVQSRFVNDRFAPSATQVEGQNVRRLTDTGQLTDEMLIDTIIGQRSPVEAIGADGRPTYMSPGAAVRAGAQPAPSDPLVSVNTGDMGDGALREKLDEAEGKRWSDLQAAGVTAAGLRQDLEFLSELIKVAPQGPLQGRLASAFPGFSSAGAAFQAIVSRAAPGLRVEGSGATSDIEYRGMLNSLPRLQNRPDANALITDMMRAKSDVNVARAAIVTDYQNGSIPANEARARLAELNSRSIMTPELRSVTGQRSAARAALDPSSGLWGDFKRAGARGVDAILDGRSARSAEQMRGEFADAVSRQGPQRDELLDAIMGYGQARTRATEQALPYEELLGAIMSGGAVAIGGRAGAD